MANPKRTFFIIICTLATVLRVEALQLVYDPLKYPEYMTLDVLKLGTVVKIPGLITAVTAYSWKERNVSIGYAFAVSENNISRVQLQVDTFAGEQNAIFCSVGILSDRSSNLGMIYYTVGVSAKIYNWRGPCKPAKVPFRGNNASCAVVLTDGGDLQLVDVVLSNIIWHSNTDGVGQSNVTVDDLGSLDLVGVGDNRTVWTSAGNDTAGSDPQCLNVSSVTNNLSGGLRVLQFPGGVRSFLTFFMSTAAFFLTSL